MEKQKSYQKNRDVGTLYLVPTPIGNLEDMTFRGIRMLKEANLIASEDTRNTQKLLNHFEITTPQLSFHQHNYKERIPKLLEMLRQGENIAQVSDAGMPAISDPGYELVVACLKEQLPVVALPGASAGITALIASGLSSEEFTFVGFLPRKSKEMMAELERLRQLQGSLIFYESPHRIHGTLKNLATVLGGNRQGVVCRELTKIHEEYLRGSLEELILYTAEESLKGECCILVEGFSPEEAQALLEDGWKHLSVEAHVEEIMATNEVSSKEAIKMVAKMRGLKKQEVYQIYHNCLDEREDE